MPTGNVPDVIEVPPWGDDAPGAPRCITATCIDNGMPVVVVAAAALGRTRFEPVAELEADPGLGRGCGRCGSPRAC